MLKTSRPLSFCYPYEEFADHIKAMKTVREWEYTSRFGHVGNAQTSLANCARVVDFFSDSYEDPDEAVRKAELFLSIYDYIARNSALFVRKGLVEKLEASLYSVDPALLRAVHHVFTAAGRAPRVDPKKVFALARAFKELEPQI